MDEDMQPHFINLTESYRILEVSRQVRLEALGVLFETRTLMARSLRGAVWFLEFIGDYGRSRLRSFEAHGIDFDVEGGDEIEPLVNTLVNCPALRELKIPLFWVLIDCLTQ